VPGNSHLHLDSIHRLLTSAMTPPGVPAGTIDYSLDGAGNRTEVSGGRRRCLRYRGRPRARGLPGQPVQQHAVRWAQYDGNGNPWLPIVFRWGGAAEVNIAYDFRNQMVRYRDDAAGRPPHTGRYLAAD
jgi:hypothetical protein